MDQCQCLEVREKARKLMFFVMSLCLSDHKVLHNITSSSSFFSISLRFSRFFRSYFVFQIFGVFLFTFSYPTRTHGIIVNYRLNSLIFSQNTKASTFVTYKRISMEYLKTCWKLICCPPGSQQVRKKLLFQSYTCWGSLQFWWNLSSLNIQI